MEMSPLVAPTGEPVFTAGGRHAWKVAEYRGYVASLEWARRRRKMLAMLVIWPASNVFTRPDAPTPGMWAISRNVITEFVGFDKDGKCTGSASQHCFREALEAMSLLGKDRNDKQAFLALVDVVVKFAPELVGMPVAPAWVKEETKGLAMWEVAAKNKATDKIITEGEA